MRRAILLALLVLLPGLAVGQSNDYARYGSAPVPGTSGGAQLQWDAANALALRNGGTAGVPVPQAFSVYNFCDGAGCATGYERLVIKSVGSEFDIVTEAAGTGTSKSIGINPSGSLYLKNFLPYSGGDTSDAGNATYLWRVFYLSRSIQGSKTKTLTESAATSLVKIAVPQTAGSNFADAEISWVAYAADATDTQTRRGKTYLTAVNKAGTETCTVGTIGTTIAAVSAGTLTCTESCVVGLTDEVEFALNCVSSLTQTTLKAQYRADMMQPNTYTPQ